jgi:flavin reductase (DIM6/NTAB) family NADH-FMN oxidoreductase RutF
VSAGSEGARAMSASSIPRVEADVTELFHEAMASLASGVSVITARRPDGSPCGLAATSVSSYSAEPPSLLAAISHASRCHDALAGCDRFGVHILHAGEEHVARAFAARAEDKFAGLDWRWDDDVPELAGALAYLRCRRTANFSRYDHTIVIGDIEGGRLEHAEPLLYARRRMDWLLHPHER